MNKLLVIVSVIMFSSCITQKKCMQRYPPANMVDSIYIETVEKIPVYIPGDTVNISSPINCPDQDLIKVENSKLKQEISIIKGKLTSKTTIKSDTVFVPVTKTVTKIKEVKVPEPVKFIPKIYKDSLWICIILFSGGFIWFGFKVYKFIRH